MSSVAVSWVGRDPLIRGELSVGFQLQRAVSRPGLLVIVKCRLGSGLVET